MYKTALVESLVDDGRKLLTQLKAERFPMSASLWFYWPERETWKLVIVSSIADEKGPHYGYTRIQKSLGKAGTTSLELDDVMLVGKKDPAFIELKITVGTPWPESLEGQPKPVRPDDDFYVYDWAT